MKLYGSPASPFVRKIRLALAGQAYDFVSMNIYESPDRERLQAISPVMKIPVLEDGLESIFDSRVIFNHLCERGLQTKLTSAGENDLTVIDGITDTFVNTFLLKRSGIELDPKSLLGQRHEQRVKLSIEYLAAGAKAGRFADWDFAAMSLYCLLDWAQFRELFVGDSRFEHHPALVEFHLSNAGRPSVSLTDPRRS